MMWSRGVVIVAVAALFGMVAADDFVKRVLERGAPDNVTVIVARAVRAMPGDDDVTLLDHKHAEITNILKDYGVPLLNGKGDAK